MGGRLVGPAVALALVLPVVCLLRPRPHPLERVHLRQGAVAAALVAGLVLAIATLQYVAPWQAVIGSG